MSVWKVPTYHAEMSDDSSYSRQADHRVFIRAEKAETAKRPLPEMSRGSNAAKDYNNVIREIMTDEEWNAAQAYIESKRRNKKTGRFQKVD